MMMNQRIKELMEEAETKELGYYFLIEKSLLS